MAIDDAELEQLQDNLTRALYSGVRRVEHGDKELEYQNISGMREVLAAVASAVDATTGTTTTGRHRRAKVRSSCVRY